MSQTKVKRMLHMPKVRMLSRNRNASSIQITDFHDPKRIKRHEENKLREQLHKEIEWRSRICGNKSYDCTLPVLCGREYCLRHILKDPSVPYQQCLYSYNNDEQCPMPAPCSQHYERKDDGLCFEHARSAQVVRQRRTAPPPAVITTESLLNQLQHYVRPERTRTTSCTSSVSVVSEPAEPEIGLNYAVDPFKQIDAATVNSLVSMTVIEAASNSDSDSDSISLGHGGNCRAITEATSPTDDDVAIPEGAKSQACIFTVEEAVSEANAALKQLKSGYINQMRRLHSLLHKERQNYLRELRAEKEHYCSINSQASGGPMTVKERKQLCKLKAYASYHRKHGVDAVMARKLHRKRAKVKDAILSRPIPSHGRCTFSEGGVRCSSAVLPASKHCLKHVLHDRQQVLFTACGDLRGCGGCREPVPRLPLPDSCRYHTDPPLHTTFTLKKQESDSDSDSQTLSDGSRTEDASEPAEERPHLVNNCVEAGSERNK